MADCSKTGFRQMAPPQQSDSQFRSSKAAPDRTALGHAAPSRSTLDQTISGRSALGQAAPSRSTLEQAVSDLAALGRTAPDQTAPGREEMRFFIYLLEQYAASRDTGADKVLKEWDRLRITDIILDRCSSYRIGMLEEAFKDIDALPQGNKK